MSDDRYMIVVLPPPTSTYALSLLLSDMPASGEGRTGTSDCPPIRGKIEVLY